MRAFVVRSALSLVGLLCVGLVFSVFLPSGTPARTSSGVLQFLGGGAGFIAEVAAHIGWIILPLAVIWLLIRGLSQLAAYVGVVALGLAAIVWIGTLLTPVARSASRVVPVEAESPFSAGGIQVAVICGALLLVFLPVIPARARNWVIVGSAAFVLAFETVRILAGPHAPWPYAGGWVLGLGWLLASALSFRTWLQPDGPRRPLRNGLPSSGTANRERALIPVQVREPSLPGGINSAFKLLGIWLLIGMFVTAIGLLIVDALAPVREFDSWAVNWMVENRTRTLNFMAMVAGAFGTTAGIVAALLAGGSLAIAVTGRKAPGAFFLVLVVGETALYLLSGLIVGRDRPAVDHLTEGLPPTSSFPSGHVAASVVMYGGLALLLLAWVRSWIRYVGVVLAPLIVLGVTLSRVYWGVHFPTDVLAGVVFASAWLAVCWRYFRPDRGSPRRAVSAVEPGMGIHA